MHIPGGMFEGAVCPATAGLAAAGFAVAGWGGAESDVNPVRLASVTALLFAAPMAAYAILGLPDGALPAALAGLSGPALTLALGCLAARLLRRKAA